jgi:hypothetical protein
MAKFISGSDESAGKTHRDTFFFGGFVAPEEDWSRFFVPAWQERVLAGPPAMPYLHMTEMRSEQWRSQHKLSRAAADERIDEAIAVIETMGSLYPVGIYVDGGHVLNEFATTKVVASTGGAKRFEPDFISFLAYAYSVLLCVERDHPEAEKVDFIVESKGHVTKYIQEFHSTLGQALTALGRPALGNLIGELISGGKEVIPLQAADVLCWHTARYMSKTMDADDERRYATIAHRKGFRHHLTNDQISQIGNALLPEASVDGLISMNLGELKSEAKRLGYSQIKRDGDETWRELKSWNGLSAHGNVALMTVHLSYYLDGNRVRVTRALDDQEYWYSLRS